MMVSFFCMLVTFQSVTNIIICHNVMLVTDIWCWCLTLDVGDVTFHQHPNYLVINIQILSPTNFVSNIRHKHRHKHRVWIFRPEMALTQFLKRIFLKIMRIYLENGLDFLSKNDASSIPRIWIFFVPNSRIGVKIGSG